jgi:hypothetical protein
VKWLVFTVSLALAAPAAAQEPVKKKKPQVAHKKPSPEQIRKFKELEKKQKKG